VKLKLHSLKEGGTYPTRQEATKGSRTASQKGVWFIGSDSHKYSIKERQKHQQARINNNLGTASTFKGGQQSRVMLSHHASRGSETRGYRRPHGNAVKPPKKKKNEEE